MQSQSPDCDMPDTAAAFTAITDYEIWHRLLADAISAQAGTSAWTSEVEQVTPPLRETWRALYTCLLMHRVNDDMWREALAEALSARAGFSIFGYGFASAGRATLALVTRIYQHVEPNPFTSKPRAVLRFFDGSKVKSAVCFYQKMLVTIKELDGHSLEAERTAVLNLTSEEAEAALENLLSYQESCDSSGGSVKVVLVVNEIDKLNNTLWVNGVIQQLLLWAHAATSRLV